MTALRSIAITALALTIAVATRADVVEPNVALWPTAIEYQPGEMLLLRPRIPSVDLRGVEVYELVLRLPAALRPVQLDLEPLDVQGSYSARIESAEHTVDGQTQAFTMRPATMRYLGMGVTPGVTYTFSCMAKGEGIVGDGFELTGYWRDADANPIQFYRRFIGFPQGDYDWREFSVELPAPENAAYLQLMLIKWQEKATWGTLYVDDLSLVSATAPETNLISVGDMENADGVRSLPQGAPLKTVVAPRPGAPDNRALKYSGTRETADRQVANWLPLPYELHPVDYGRPLLAPTVCLQVPDGFSGSHLVEWAAVTDGTTVLSGELPLIAAPATKTPGEIELTIWLAESDFELLSHSLQDLYLKRLQRLGVNGVMTTIREPDYDVDLDEIDITNWTAQWARQHGMDVRSYLWFLYTRGARSYCEQHPEYWATTWIGEKTSDYRVCLTHALDGDKYDDEKTGVGAGCENPWLGRLCEVCTRSVQVNDLQGVWWDFEIAGVPIRKERPRPYEPHGHRQVCTDLRCRRAFAEYAGLAQVPTVEQIMADEYYERFNDFKCWQHARVWELMKQAARRANPDADFRIYSGLPGPYTRQAYGVDWTIGARAIDVAMSVHTGRNLEEFARAHQEASRAGGGNEKLLMSVSVNGYDQEEHITCWRARPSLPNQLVQTVVDWDCVGLALCGVWGFDSQFNACVRQAAAVFADYEDILTAGTHDDALLQVAPADLAYAAWSSADGKRLVGFLFNNSAEAREVAIARTNTWASATEGQDVVATDDGITLTIEPWAHRVVELRR